MYGAGEDCGRADWPTLTYTRYGAHRPLDPKESVVLDAQRTGDGVSVTIYNAGEPVHYYPPSNFVTNDGGLTWEGVAQDKAASLNNIWSKSFVRASSNILTLYKRIEGLDLYVRSLDGGMTWNLPEYTFEGMSSEEFASKVGVNRSYHLQIFIDAVHPLQPRTLFASIRFAPWVEENTSTSRELDTVFISRDGGDRWTKFNDSLAAFSVGNAKANFPIGISAKDPRYYIGVGKVGKLEGVPVSGIVISADGGKSWAPVGQQRELMAPIKLRGGQSNPTTSFEAVRIFQFAFDPDDVATIYVVSGKGLFKSTDGGHSWRLLDLGVRELNSINSLAINPLNGKQLYVGSRNGVFRSDDGGCAFHKIFPATKESNR
jgi:hypothetical protein